VAGRSRAWGMKEQKFEGYRGGAYSQGCPWSSEPRRWSCPESTVILLREATVTDRRLGSFRLGRKYCPSRRVLR
jgi:hypothetical protein